MTTNRVMTTRFVNDGKTGMTFEDIYKKSERAALWIFGISAKKESVLVLTPTKFMMCIWFR